MKQRQLGRSGLSVAAALLRRQRVRLDGRRGDLVPLLDAFVDAGFNFIDTADVYSRWVPGHSGGESETIIGNWLKARGKRDQRRDRHQGRHGHGRRQGGLSPRYIARGRRGLAARLQTDRIDLYQSHKDDPDDAARGDARGLSAS